VFARKIIRSPSSSLSIQNELRAVQKLCNGRHRNVIKVLNTRELTEMSVFIFIDMELCEMNLDQFNAACWPEKAKPLWVGAKEIWNIMAQIADGLTFIHDQKEIHRDLKPRNGNPHATVVLTA
jgi:serine/threonine protein kinase